MTQTELKNKQEKAVSIPVYCRGKLIDRLIAAPGSRPVRIAEGMQFTDSFGIHPAKTAQEYRTPMTIEATVMTDSTNIVLQFGKGEVILNWDRREDMLRVRHPATGQPFDLPGKGAVPVGRWHHLEWIIAEDVMRVLVNGEERFALHGNYRGLQGTIGIRTGWRANLSIGSLHIEEHHGTDESTWTGYRAAAHPNSFAGCALGAMRYCNRYAEETGLLGGIGYWFWPILPNESLDREFSADVLELLKPFGLELRRLDVSVSEGDGLDTLLQFVKESFKRQEAVFGFFGEKRGYAAVTGMANAKLQLASPDGSVYEAEPRDAVALFAVRPGPEASGRNKAMTAFRWASELGLKSGHILEAAWLAVLDTAEAAHQAAALAERRKEAAGYLRSCREDVGGMLAERLEAAARSCERAGSSWARTAGLLAAGNASEAGSSISQAVAAESEAARMLGEIAAALGGKKLLEGLRYWGYSCISQHNTLTGVADYFRIQGPNAWILGASGRPFAFAVHDRVNVHDICLPIPEHRFIRMFANIGLAIDGVEGSGKDEDYWRLLETAWNKGRAAIDEGSACFGRSVDFDRGEYSVIVGYDQDGYYTHSWHGPSHKAIPWNMYGLGQCTCLQCTTRRTDWRTEGPVKSVCQCDVCRKAAKYGPALEPQPEGDVRLYWAKPLAPADDRTVVREALQFAVEFAMPDGPWAKPEMHTGTQAYDRLIRALEKGTMDGWYLGLYANGWHECRTLILEFLQEGKRRIGGGPQLAEAFDRAIREAERLRRSFAMLYEMFPWMQPFGPIPDTERRYAGAELLLEARKHEAASIKAYRELLERL